MSDPRQVPHARRSAGGARQVAIRSSMSRRELDRLRRRGRRAEGHRQATSARRVARSGRFRRAVARARPCRTLHRRAGGELLRWRSSSRCPRCRRPWKRARSPSGWSRKATQVKSGRHPRRDRDRQGDDGIRSGRRRHDRQDPGRRGHREREGRHGDRAAGGRGRGRLGRSRRLRHAAAEAPRGCRSARARRPKRPAAGAQAPRRRSEIPAGTDDGQGDRARGAARRDGRGNAPRRPRVRDGRGSRRVSGRLQGHPGPARGVRRPSA